MARRHNIVRPIPLNTAIPEDIRAWLDLHLFSELEGRVPKGAYQAFILRKIKEEREWRRLDLEALGLPAGFFVCGPPGMLDALRISLIDRNHTTAVLRESLERR
jgi:ferredoxin-NADP reductase